MAPTENLSERRRTEKLRERLATRREQRAIESRVGSRRGLGDASDDDEGAAAWVSRSRQLQTDKALASKRVGTADGVLRGRCIGEFRLEHNTVLFIYMQRRRGNLLKHLEPWRSLACLLLC